MKLEDWVIDILHNPYHPERARVEPGEVSASRRIPTGPVAGNAASGNSYGTSSGASDDPITCDHPITRYFRILWAVLREIFDESAYQRFLHRTGLAHSAASYHAFIAERDAASKPRCC